MSKSGAAKRILLIVEGQRREPQLLERELEVFGLADERKIVPLGTDIHALLDFIDDEYEGAYEDIDLREVVADFLDGRVDDAPRLEEALSGEYTDVLLVFDFDPQDNRFDAERLRRLQSAYCDSTDLGQLYINYPMVEAYRDFDDVLDQGYLDALVPAGAVFHGSGYKDATARRRNAFRDVTRACQFDFARNIALQASKAQYLTQGKDPDDCAAWNDDSDLAKAFVEVDLNALSGRAVDDLGQGRLWACCTCLLFVAGWPAALNGVWKKALESGLGLGAIRDGVR